MPEGVVSGLSVAAVSSSSLPVSFQNAAVTLREHPHGYVIFEYQAGKREFADYQAAHTHTNHLLHRREWRKILADQRLMSPFTEEETTWVTTYWLDQNGQRPGGIYAALLLANDVFARLSATPLRQEAKAAALTYRLFEDEAAAAAWLVQLG
jgi:hypothetical protein